ncbi:MAG: helix-turn-helix transcriptional regulator [Gammaproteobacteria bacterium]
MARIRPGEHLADFLEDYKLTQYALAFGTTAQLWLNLQNQYDVECAQLELTDGIKREVSRERICRVKLLPDAPASRAANTCGRPPIILLLVAGVPR